MATTTNITSNYAGEVAAQMISPALYEGPTLGERRISINENIQFKWNVVRISDDGIISDGTCDFTPTDTTTWDERVLQPKEFQVNRQYCKSDFLPTWENMKGSAFKNVPGQFGPYMVSYLGEQVAQRMEFLVWNGVEASAGEFDGFATLFEADADVIDVTGAAITAANVIDALQAVYLAIPKSVMSAKGGDLAMYIADDVYRAYQTALGGFQTGGQGAAGYMAGGTVDEKPLRFNGIQLYYTPGLNDGQIVAARASNLWFGTSLQADLNKVQTIDMADLDGSQNFRFIMRFMAGVQYGYGAEIVYGKFA